MEEFETVNYMSEHDTRSVNRRKFYDQLCTLKYKAIMIFLTFVLAILSLIALTVMEKAIEKCMEKMTSVMTEFIINTSNSTHDTFD